MDETIRLGDGVENAISVNTERGPTMIWRDGDTVTLVMRLLSTETEIPLSRIEARVRDLSAKAQHDFHLREVFTQIFDEGRSFDPDDSRGTA